MSFRYEVAGPGVDQVVRKEADIKGGRKGINNRGTVCRRIDRHRFNYLTFTMKYIIACKRNVTVSTCIARYFISR